MGRPAFKKIHSFIQAAKSGIPLHELALSEGLTDREALNRLESCLHWQPQVRMRKESSFVSRAGRPSGKNPDYLLLTPEDIKPYRDEYRRSQQSRRAVPAKTKY